MALPSSGEITINDIRTELGETTGSLRSLSATAGFTSPDAMSEFYGYSAAIDPTEHFSVSTYEGNGSTQKVTGAIGGQAATFNGSSSRVDISSLKSFFGQKGTSSVCYWFKVSTHGSGNDHLFNDYNGSSSPTNFNQYHFINSSGYINVFTRYNNGGASSTLSYIGSTNLRDNNWHHLAVVVNQTAGTRQTYLDGSLLQNSSLPAGSYVNSPTASWFVNLGNLYVGSNNEPLDGYMDDVRIYNDALTSTEVGYIYNNTTASIPTSNLEAHYKLNGNVTDEQGSHDGTAYNIGYAGSNFQPDLVWIKDRGDTSLHVIFDSLRGATKYISSASNAAEATGTTTLTSFDSTGFTVSSSGAVNQSGSDNVAWSWKAGGTGVSNTDGSITSTVSANQAAGFSIIKYIGNATSGATIGHGLSAAPELVIVKELNPPTVRSWGVYHKDVGNQYYLLLDTDAAAVSNSTVWNNTSPSSSVITLGSASLTNDNGRNLVAYAFHSVSGYSKIGTYTGNGSDNGPTITTGFKPRLIILKGTDIVKNWRIHDIYRDYNSSTDITQAVLYPDTNDAEAAGADRIAFTSTGFQIVTASQGWNNNGSTYLYLAIA